MPTSSTATHDATKSSSSNIDDSLPNDEQKKLKIINAVSKETNISARINEDFSILMLAVSEIMASLFDRDDDEVYAICNFIGALSGALGASGYWYWIGQNKLRNKKLSKWQKWVLNKLSLQKNAPPSMFHGYQLSFEMPIPEQSIQEQSIQEKTLYLKMDESGLCYLLRNPDQKKGPKIFEGVIENQLLENDNLPNSLSEASEDKLKACLPKIYWIIVDQHLFGKDRPAPKENPWPRIWKTSYVAGKNLGDLIGRFIPLPFFSHINLTGKILGFVLGIICGFGALLFFREELTESQHRYLKLGKDGWTKYGKTGLVYGSSVGGMIGGLLGLSLGPAGIAAGVALGSLMGGIAGFAGSIVMVPIFNYFKLKLYPDENSSFRQKSDTYRTNYIRAGLSLGACAGAFIGGILGTVVFPGIGTMGGMALGGAIGGVAGGVVWGFLAPQVASKIENANSANTYDYSVRTSIMFGDKTGLGGALKSVPVIGNFVASLCGFVAGIAGGVYEIFNARKLREIKREGDKEKKEQGHILPWTQWVPTGIVFGSAVGGFIGFFVGGPIGMLIGSGIGGLFGGVLALYVEPLLRKFGLIPTVALVVPVSGEQPPPSGSPRSSSAHISNTLLSSSEHPDSSPPAPTEYHPLNEDGVTSLASSGTHPVKPPAPSCPPSPPEKSPRELKPMISLEDREITTSDLGRTSVVVC